MPKKYSHLTDQDRIFLRVMLEKRYPKAKISKILNIHRSTLYREIKRNSCTHSYSGRKYYDSRPAQEKYLKRRKRGLKLEKDKELRDYVHAKLKLGWSPWQIEGRLKLENKNSDNNLNISHETIYRYIYSDSNRRYRFFRCLRRKHPYRIKKNQKRPRKVSNDILISNRPEIIGKREEFGHWEGDLMVFKQGERTNLITLVERKTRLTVAIKNNNRKAKTTSISMISSLKNLKSHIKSITLDQGSEFMAYPLIKDCLDTDIYFCNPASPHQKGSIENRNAVLRLDFPRSYKLETLSQKDLDKTVRLINNKPMKCLGFLTPLEAFEQEKLDLSLS